jgi:hypothetical protein
MSASGKIETRGGQSRKMHKLHSWGNFFGKLGLHAGAVGALHAAQGDCKVRW